MRCPAALQMTSAVARLLGEVGAKPAEHGAWRRSGFSAASLPLFSLLRPRAALMSSWTSRKVNSGCHPQRHVVGGGLPLDRPEEHAAPRMAGAVGGVPIRPLRVATAEIMRISGISGRLVSEVFTEYRDVVQGCCHFIVHALQALPPVWTWKPSSRGLLRWQR